MAVYGEATDRSLHWTTGFKSLSIVLSPRICLLLLSLPAKWLFSTLNGLGDSLSNTGLSLAGTAVWVGWFVLLWLAAMPETDLTFSRYLGWMRRVALPTTLALAALMVIIVTFTITVRADWILPKASQPIVNQLIASSDNAWHYNDAAALSQQATDNLLLGENPYASANIVTAMSQFGSPANGFTPLRKGSFAEVFPYPSYNQLDAVWQQAQVNPDDIPIEMESHYDYPAGGFLLSVPFVAAGITDIHWILLFFLLLGVGYAFWRLPPKNRFIFVLAVAASIELWGCVAGGDTSNLAFPFLIIGWLLLREKPLAAAILLGVAAAAKQTAWFVIPFALILLYSYWEWKQALKAAAAVAAVFLAFNLPFIIASPGLWLDSIMAPMRDLLFPMGSGLISLVTRGVLNIQSSLPFTLAEALAFIGGVIWYLFNVRKYPLTGLLLAMLPLFFAWRSLNNYFYYTDIILLAVLLIDGRLPKPRLNAPLLSRQPT